MELLLVANTILEKLRMETNGGGGGCNAEALIALNVPFLRRVYEEFCLIITK